MVGKTSAVNQNVSLLTSMEGFDPRRRAAHFTNMLALLVATAFSPDRVLRRSFPHRLQFRVLHTCVPWQQLWVRWKHVPLLRPLFSGARLVGMTAGLACPDAKVFWNGPHPAPPPPRLHSSVQRKPSGLGKAFYVVDSGVLEDRLLCTGAGQ